MIPKYEMRLRQSPTFRALACITSFFIDIVHGFATFATLKKFLAKKKIWEKFFSQMTDARQKHGH
jgi:hypothetical protein